MLIIVARIPPCFGLGFEQRHPNNALKPPSSMNFEPIRLDGIKDLKKPGSSKKRQDKLHLVTN